MKEENELFKIFPTGGCPSVTYVKKQDGRVENKLNDGLDDRGRLCLITGPSKSGKTTLYERVLAKRGLKAIPVGCNGSMSAEDIWREALEKAEFERTTSSETGEQKEASLGGKISSKLGWLVGVSGEASGGIKRGDTSSERKQRVVAKPSSAHLVDAMGESDCILVLEDFQYLQPAVQKVVFQQWKVLIDNSVSTIVVGTSHRASDIAKANSHLAGRICGVNIKQWNTEDLKEIIIKGSRYLGVALDAEIRKTIALESAGLPAITQEVCRELMKKLGVTKPVEERLDREIPIRWVYQVLYKVASTSYARILPRAYGRIVDPSWTGRGRTYDLILSSFALNPLAFSLSLPEVRRRLAEELPLRESPPADDDVSDMLNNLGEIQDEIGIALLDWNIHRQLVYITEPSFLFSLRWRKPKERPASSVDVFDQIMGDFSKKS